VPLGNTNFLVAEAGKELIHPIVGQPLELAGVKSTFQSEHPRTLILMDYESPEPKVEIVWQTHRLDGILRAHDVGCILTAKDEKPQE
jgi:hypothetical protein